MTVNLAREALKEVNAYESSRGEGLWLNANEYPETVPFALREGLRMNYYPEMQSSALRKAYADYAGVEPGQVLIARGGDEAINVIVRTYCDAGDSYAYCPPTYSMYRAYGDIQGAKPVTCVTREADGFAVDALAVQKAIDEGARLVFICSPNNPTGQFVPRETFEAVLEAARGRAMVVADEAYVEFNPERTLAGLLRDHDNLLVIRTLSKAFALAGLRCGFVLGNPEAVASMGTVIDPYPVPVPVEDIALQALSATGVAAMRERAAKMRANCEVLVRGLSELPQVDRVFEANANFALARFKDARAVFARLAQDDIYVRDQRHMPGLANCLRISVGTRSDIARVLASIAAVPV